MIIPELGDFSSADFEGAEGIIHLGYEAALASKESLAILARPDYDALSRPGPEKESGNIVHFIDIDNGSVLKDELIRSRVALELGQPLNLGKLDKSVDQIYSLDVFESVTYDLVRNEKGEQGVVIHASPRSWGPNYFQLGLELSSDFSESSDFKLGAAYTRNALNSLGGELRVIGSIGRQDEISFDFYQPIDLQANWYVQPQIFWRRQNENYWEEDVNIAKLRIGVLGAGFGVGRNLSTTDRLSLNYEYALGDADVITGDPGFPVDDRVRIGELRLEYFHDSLDNLYFPGSGMLHRLDYLYAAEELGADIDYQQAWAAGAFAFSHNRNNLVLNFSGGYSFDDDAPFERWFRLGGLGRLSGLAPDQLSGRHLILASLAYYRRLNSLDIFPVYAGFTLEAGNVWEYSDDIGLDDLRYSASIFLGADSPIGPVYLAYGHSDNGDNAIYFYVGNPFRATRFD